MTFPYTSVMFAVGIIFVIIGFAGAFGVTSPYYVDFTYLAGIGLLVCIVAYTLVRTKEDTK